MYRCGNQEAVVYLRVAPCAELTSLERRMHTYDVAVEYAIEKCHRAQNVPEPVADCARHSAAEDNEQSAADKGEHKAEISLNSWRQKAEVTLKAGHHESKEHNVRRNRYLQGVGRCETYTQQAKEDNLLTELNVTVTRPVKQFRMPTVINAIPAHHTV